MFQTALPGCYYHKKGGRQILYFLLGWPILVAAAVLFSLPWLVSRKMLRPVKFRRIYTGEEFGLSAQELSLKTSDGLKLAAWEVFTPAPKAVIIFVSGINHPSVTGFFPHAKLLQKHGFASFLLEMRAHGKSEGNRICLGFKEYLDVQAAVSHLNRDSKYEGVPIAAFGLSMGGATVINAIGMTPKLAGVITLSAFSSPEDVFCDYLLKLKVPGFFIALQKPFLRLFSILRFGWSSLGIIPKEQIKNLGSRPALIIHSKEDSQVFLANFERLTANAPPHIETWLREGDQHFIYQSHLPWEDPEYAQRILGFLEKHFDRSGKKDPEDFEQMHL